MITFVVINLNNVDSNHDTCKNRHGTILENV